MTADLRTRFLTAGLDRLALACVALGFVLLAVYGVLNGHGPLYFAPLFLAPILTPGQGGYGVAEVFFSVGLILAVLAAVRRLDRAHRTPAVAAGDPSSTLGQGWRERASRAAAILSERRASGTQAERSRSDAPVADQPLLMMGERAISDDDETAGFETDGDRP